MELVSDTPKPPLTTTTSIWPAAIVLIVGVVTLTFFMLVNVLANPKVATTTTLPYIVGGLSVDEHATLLQGCERPGNPPSDVASGLVVPQQSAPSGPVNLQGQGPGSFDCSRTITTPASQDAVLSFYRSQDVARGWKLFSNGAASNTGQQQLLLQKAGSDTFYWILGITVRAHTASSTTYTVRIYQGAGLI